MPTRKEQGKLKEYLSKYNELTVPDNYFYAYNILLLKIEYPHKEEILEQAMKDMKEEKDLRFLTNFNRDRRRMDNLVKRKYNWGSRW